MNFMKANKNVHQDTNKLITEDEVCILFIFSSKNMENRMIVGLFSMAQSMISLITSSITQEVGILFLFYISKLFIFLAFHFTHIVSIQLLISYTIFSTIMFV